MYQGPEGNTSYQEYWSQYPDESEDTPQWLNHFQRPNDISNGDYTQVALIEEEDSNDDADNPFVLYSSPKRIPVTRSPPITKFEFSYLKPNALSKLLPNVEELLSKQSLRSQIIYLVDLLRPSDSEPLASYNEIAKVFGMEKGTIYSHYKKGEEIVDSGRQPVLTDNEINEIINLIHENYFAKVPVTYDSIVYFLKDRFQKEINIKTLYGQLSRVPQIKSIDADPMEKNRVDCPIELIEQFYNDLESILDTNKIPSAFVFNIDEAGFSEWADSTKMTVLVPVDAKTEDTKIPIEREGKRASFLAGICADGSTLKPAIVVPRKTIELELYDQGYTPDKLCICSSDSGFFATEQFLTWAFECFFPEIRKKREEYKYKGECLLILDGFGPHENDEFLNACTDEGIIPLPLAPHSSDQTQPLDIGIFAVQKYKMNKMTVPEDLSQQSSQLIRIVDSFTQAATISNIMSAFRGAGIVSSYDTNLGLMPRVDRASAKKVRYWVSVSKTTFNKKRLHL